MTEQQISSDASGPTSFHRRRWLMLITTLIVTGAAPAAYVAYLATGEVRPASTLSAGEPVDRILDVEFSSPAPATGHIFTPFAPLRVSAPLKTVQPTQPTQPAQWTQTTQPAPPRGVRATPTPSPIASLPVAAPPRPAPVASPAPADRTERCHGRSRAGRGAFCAGSRRALRGWECGRKKSAPLCQMRGR